MGKKKKFNVNILSKFWILVSYLLVSFIIIAPLIKSKELFYGDDIVFQLNRIDNLVGYVQSGNFQPILSTFSFKNLGLITNMAYPYGTLYFYAFIKCLVVNPILSVYISMGLLTFLTMILAHFSMHVLSGSTKSALIFSFTYAFSMYRMIDMVTRFDLGELLCMLALPVFIVGILELLFDKYKYWWMVPLGATLIFSSHILTAVLVSLFTVICFIFYIFSRNVTNKKIRSKYVIISILITIMLNIYQIVMVAYGLIQHLELPVVTQLIDSDIDFFDLVKHSLSNNIDRSTTMGIGFVIAVMIILILIDFKKISYKYQIIFYVSALFLVASTSFFPWSVIQHTPLSIVQFPSRLLMIPTCGLAMVGSIVLSNHVNHNLLVSYLLFIVMLNISIVFSFVHYNSVNPFNADAPVLIKGSTILTDEHHYDKIVHNDWYYDYLPKQSVEKNKSLKNKKIYTAAKRFTVVSQPISNGITFNINNKSKNTEQFNLPFILYKHLDYIVTVDGKKVNTSRSPRMSLLVNVPSGTHKIQTKLIIPKLISITYVLNLLTYFIVGLAIVRGLLLRKEKHTQI